MNQITSLAPLATVVVEISGGAIYCARASAPARIIILDHDVEGGDGDRVKEINGEEFYVHDFALTSPADPCGIDQGYVVDIVNQVDAGDGANEIKDGQGTLCLSNSIESVVPFLFEVGQYLLVAADYVKNKEVALARVKTEVERLEQFLQQDRDALLQRVREHYVNSEIEAADVMLNRTATN